MKRALITAFVTVLTLSLAACGSEESSASTTESTTSAPPAAQGGGGGGSPCARARECCDAYVELVGGGVAGQACAGIDAAEQAGGAAADMSCNQMISSWRTAFTSMSRDVPASCQ